MRAPLPLGVIGPAIVVFASGCAVYEPKPLLPEAELALLKSPDLAAIIVEHGPPGEAAPRGAVPFDPSDGLDETEIVALALTLNPALKAKRLEIGEAQALLISAGIWPNPSVGFSLLPGVAGASGWTADTDLLFELLRPGERASKQAVAQAQIDQVSAEVVAEEWKLVADVRRQRMTLAAQRRQAELLDQEVSLREQVLQLLQRRRELGEVRELDIALADIDLAEIRRDRRVAAAELEAALIEMNRRIGLPGSFALKFPPTENPLRFTVYPTVTEQDVEQRLLAGRFELRAAHAAYAKSEGELRLAIERQFPRISLGPSHSREPEGTNFLGLGVSIELPFFDRNQGEIATMDIRREQARARYASLLYQVVTSAYEALARLRRTQQEVEILERDVIPSLQRTQDLFERGFRSRDVGLFEWIMTRQRALKVRQAYLDALLRYQNSVIDLEAATGVPLAQPIESRPEGGS